MKNGRMMLQYVRDSRRNPIGCVVAFPENGKIQYGWSLCKKKPKKDRYGNTIEPPDQWDREEGINIAIRRAVPEKQLLTQALNGQVAHSVAKDLSRLVEKSQRFYRTRG